MWICGKAPDSWEKSQDFHFYDIFNIKNERKFPIKAILICLHNSWESMLVIESLGINIHGLWLISGVVNSHSLIKSIKERVPFIEEQGRNGCLKIRGTKKETDPFLFRSFLKRISRKILNNYTKISHNLYTLQYKSQNFMRNR